MNGFLHIENLTRRFKGVAALDNLSLDIPEHATAALVGANGAGKTTTFSVIARYIRPHAGRVLIDGISLSDYRTRGGTIGLLPQDVNFFENRSVRRQLVLFAGLSGLASKAARREADRVLELVGLADRAGAKVAELSRGMKVRLGTAQALLAKPELVMLDEPMAGLDPRMRKAFRDSIRAIKGSTTLVISSHELSELQLLCDYVCIIDKGRLVRSGPIHEMIAGRREIVYHFEPAEFSLEELRTRLAGVDLHRVDATSLCATFDAQTLKVAEVNRSVLGWFMDNNVPIVAVNSESSLESAYLEMVDQHDESSESSTS